MMVLDKNYLGALFSSIPMGLIRKLISMGFPMAGMDYEILDNKVVFGTDIEITFDGKTRILGKPVNEKIFSAFSLIASMYNEEFAEWLYKRGYFQRFRVIKNAGLESGWYTYFPLGYEESMPTKEVFGVRIVDGVPQKKIQRGVKYIEAPSNEERLFVFRDGKVSVKYIIDSWSGSNEVIIMFDRLVLRRFDYTIDYFDDWDIVDSLKKIYGELEKERYKNMFHIRADWQNLYAGRNFMILVPNEMSWNGVKEFMKEVLNDYSAFFENGWTYLYIQEIGNILFGRTIFRGFVKNIGSTTVYYQPDTSRVGFEFKNGRVTPQIEVDIIPENKMIYEILKSLFFF